MIMILCIIILVQLNCVTLMKVLNFGKIILITDQLHLCLPNSYITQSYLSETDHYYFPVQHT